jgi:hypothetical protein
MENGQFCTGEGSQIAESPQHSLPFVLPFSGQRSVVVQFGLRVRPVEREILRYA